MYTNGGNGNGNGNGSKRTKLTLSDLKGGASDVATADEDFPELLNEREGTSSERTTTSALSRVLRISRACQRPSSDSLPAENTRAVRSGSISSLTP